MSKQESEKSEDVSAVEGIVRLPDRMLDDNTFPEFCEKHGYTEDEVIDQMIKEGWTQGLAKDWKTFQYWPA